jgi:hypothetical protein
MVVFTGWSFASSCSPPRLSAAQLLPLRSGLSPNSLECARGRTRGGCINRLIAGDSPRDPCERNQNILSGHGARPVPALCSSDRKHQEKIGPPTACRDKLAKSDWSASESPANKGQILKRLAVRPDQPAILLPRRKARPHPLFGLIQVGEA